MANPSDQHPLNLPGEFFNDLSCTDCGLCPELAPSIFKRDQEEGACYVWKQPETDHEKSAALEAMESCPTESIGQNN